MAVRVTVAAIDLGGQIDRVGDAIGDFGHYLGRVHLGYLALALLLSLGLQLCRAHGWANALRAAYPREAVSERGVVGAFLVGAGMNGILPARGGDAIKIVLAKRSVRNSSYPAIISSFAVLAPFDTAIGLCVLIYAITQGLLPSAPRLPELPAFEISYWAAHPQVLLLTITVLGIAVVCLVAVLAKRVEQFWAHLK